MIRLEENIAEKIARLNRATPARDMYDLHWAMTNTPITGKLDHALVRRLAILKIWVDANGLHAGDTFWKPGHEGPAFNPAGTRLLCSRAPGYRRVLRGSARDRR